MNRRTLLAAIPALAFLFPSAKRPKFARLTVWNQRRTLIRLHSSAQDHNVTITVPPMDRTDIVTSFDIAERLFGVSLNMRNRGYSIAAQIEPLT